jgi:CBS domain-containing protein
MLTNPLWRQPLASFRVTCATGSTGRPDGPMHLAIFFDAAAVAGDASLLQEARAHLDRILSGRTSTWRALPPRPTSSGAGQLVQAADHRARRTAAGPEEAGHLSHRARRAGAGAAVRRARTGTAARLTRLVALDRLDPCWRATCSTRCTADGLRLTHQLRQRAQGQAASNEVRPSELSTLEREPLHDALAIVKRFRGYLRQHFKLDACDRHTRRPHEGPPPAQRLLALFAAGCAAV